MFKSQSSYLEEANKLLLSSSQVAQEPYIHTQDSRFYVSNPTWSINAIAHALGQTARYRGNADEFYSVAEHSVLVSLLMEEIVGGDPKEGLLHDATESVMPDVSAPFKQLFPDLRRTDKALETSLRSHFGLQPEKSQEATKADWLALFIEAAQILPERGADFADPYNLRREALKLREKDGWRIGCVDWRDAKEIFLDRWREVSK